MGTTDSFIMSMKKASCVTLHDFMVLGYHLTKTNPDVSYLMWMELRVGTTTVRVGQALQVLVNGNPFSGGAMPSGITSINILTGVVVTTFGVSIQFNGKHKGHIWIPFSYQNCVAGLCGDADGDKNDEFVNKQGRNCATLPSNQKEWCFGNSWGLTFPSTQPTRDRLRMRCNRRCSTRFNGIKYCGALTRRWGPFRRCLVKKVRHSWFGQSTNTLFIHVKQNDVTTAKKLACETLEAFAEECGDKLVRRNWRRTTGCLCPGELEWTTCGRECTRTCRQPTISCGFKCVKKCQCPRSAPYQQGTSCLTQAKCQSLHLWPLA
ncbi:hypothetical protein NP493_1212g00036 [Ridgeia piscesae]|uniref:VWFD domain-containing protein n=1 Tax=Ridgeia piscesae TaxID=27915 RepID=A0AAD9KD20_RIDPI|nr:hypothetical protein NP493_1212g00036 [Ridgeia piscesae]